MLVLQGPSGTVSNNCVSGAQECEGSWSEWRSYNQDIGRRRRYADGKSCIHSGGLDAGSADIEYRRRRSAWKSDGGCAWHNSGGHDVPNWGDGNTAYAECPGSDNGPVQRAWGIGGFLPEDAFCWDRYMLENPG